MFFCITDQKGGYQQKQSYQRGKLRGCSLDKKQFLPHDDIPSQKKVSELSRVSLFFAAFHSVSEFVCI